MPAIASTVQGTAMVEQDVHKANQKAPEVYATRQQMATSGWIGRGGIVRFEAGNNSGRKRGGGYVVRRKRKDQKRREERSQWWAAVGHGLLELFLRFPVERWEGRKQTGSCW